MGQRGHQREELSCLEDSTESKAVGTKKRRSENGDLDSWLAKATMGERGAETGYYAGRGY